MDCRKTSLPTRIGHCRVWRGDGAQAYDFDGDASWATQTENAEWLAVAGTPNGFVVGGDSGPISDFGSGTSAGPQFLASFGPTGDLAEVRSYGSQVATNQALSSIATSSDGSVAFTASLVGPQNFDGTVLAPTGTGIGPDASSRDIALVVLDPP